MGINHLQLSPELIAALYPETLVAGNDPVPVRKPVKTAKPVENPAPPIPFMGRNLRSICFLVDYPDQDFLPEEQLVFLNKILAACKLSLEDIALVNTAGSPLQLAELKKQLNPGILFLWGIPPASIGLNPGLRDFNISQEDGVTVVPVFSQELMSGDSPAGKELKTRLWICLQKLFNL